MDPLNQEQNQLQQPTAEASPQQQQPMPPTQQPVQTTPPLPQPVSPPQQVPTAPSSPPISGGSKKGLVIGLIVLGLSLVGAGGFVFYTMQQTNYSAKGYQKKQYAAPVKKKDVMEKKIITPSPTIPVSALGSTDTSDTQLDADMQNIENDLTKLDSDLTNVDQGLQEKSVSLN